MSEPNCLSCGAPQPHPGAHFDGNEFTCERRRAPLSVSEAGRRGGKKTHAKYGPTFYEEIGRKGGIATQARNAEAKAVLEALKRGKP